MCAKILLVFFKQDPFSKRFFSLHFKGSHGGLTFQFHFGNSIVQVLGICTYIMFAKNERS